MEMIASVEKNPDLVLKLQNTIQISHAVGKSAIYIALEHTVSCQCEDGPDS